MRRRLDGADESGGAGSAGTGAGHSAEESLANTEELLARLETARTRLESTEDPDGAIEVLQELADLAKEVEAELQRARRQAETDAAGA